MSSGVTDTTLGRRWANIRAMDAYAWLSTLHWNLVFAAKALIQPRDAVLLAGGALLAAPWLFWHNGSRLVARALRGLLRTPMLAVAAILLGAYASSDVTGDPQLALQLRASVLHAALTLLAGAGALAAAAWLWTLRRRG